MPDDGSSCSVGELYNEEDNYKFCIDKNNLVTVNADDDASYFVNDMIESTFIYKENVTMHSQYYVIVNIKSGNIIFNDKGNFFIIQYKI